MRHESNTILDYYHNDKKTNTKPFKVGEIVLSVMKDMPCITTSEFIAQEQYLSNDGFVSKVMDKINKFYTIGSKVNANNIIWEKKQSWDTLKAKFHQAFSKISGKEEYYNWRTFNHGDMGRIKIRLDYEKTPIHIYEWLDRQSTTRMLDRMRSKYRRLKTYNEIAGVNSPYLLTDKKYIRGVEEKI